LGNVLIIPTMYAREKKGDQAATFQV